VWRSADGARRQARDHPRMTAAARDLLCRLELIAGHAERCPGEPCPFWEPGGAALAGGCVLDRVGFEIDRRPEVASLLLEMRHRIEHARDDADVEAARVALSHALNDELLDDT
jgi:hypothetical protein